MSDATVSSTMNIPKATTYFYVVPKCQVTGTEDVYVRIEDTEDVFVNHTEGLKSNGADQKLVEACAESFCVETGGEEPITE
jgi:hypothetical protein